jgi:hypothetical protein
LTDEAVQRLMQRHASDDINSSDRSGSESSESDSDHSTVDVQALKDRRRPFTAARIRPLTERKPSVKARAHGHQKVSEKIDHTAVLSRSERLSSTTSSIATDVRPVRPEKTSRIQKLANGVMARFRSPQRVAATNAHVPDTGRGSEIGMRPVLSLKAASAALAKDSATLLLSKTTRQSYSSLGEHIETAARTINELSSVAALHVISSDLVTALFDKSLFDSRQSTVSLSAAAEAVSYRGDPAAGPSVNDQLSFASRTIQELIRSAKTGARRWETRLHQGAAFIARDAIKFPRIAENADLQFFFPQHKSPSNHTQPMSRGEILVLHAAAANQSSEDEDTHRSIWNRRLLTHTAGPIAATQASAYHQDMDEIQPLDQTFRPAPTKTMFNPRSIHWDKDLTPAPLLFRELPQDPLLNRPLLPDAPETSSRPSDASGSFMVREPSAPLNEEAHAWDAPDYGAVEPIATPVELLRVFPRNFKDPEWALGFCDAYTAAAMEEPVCLHLLDPWTAVVDIYEAAPRRSPLARSRKIFAPNLPFHVDVQYFGLDIATVMENRKDFLTQTFKDAIGSHVTIIGKCEAALFTCMSCPSFSVPEEVDVLAARLALKEIAKGCNFLVNFLEEKSCRQADQDNDLIPCVSASIECFRHLLCMPTTGNSSDLLYSSLKHLPFDADCGLAPKPILIALPSRPRFQEAVTKMIPHPGLPLEPDSEPHSSQSWTSKIENEGSWMLRAFCTLIVTVCKIAHCMVQVGTERFDPTTVAALSELLSAMEVQVLQVLCDFPECFVIDKDIFKLSQSAEMYLDAPMLVCCYELASVIPKVREGATFGSEFLSRIRSLDVVPSWMMCLLARHEYDTDGVAESVSDHNDTLRLLDATVISERSGCVNWKYGLSNEIASISCFISLFRAKSSPLSLFEFGISAASLVRRTVENESENRTILAAEAMTWLQCLQESFSVFATTKNAILMPEMRRDPNSSVYASSQKVSKRCGLLLNAITQDTLAYLAVTGISTRSLSTKHQTPGATVAAIDSLLSAAASGRKAYEVAKTFDGHMAARAYCGFLGATEALSIKTVCAGIQQTIGTRKETKRILPFAPLTEKDGRIILSTWHDLSAEAPSTRNDTIATVGHMPRQLLERVARGLVAESTDALSTYLSESDCEIHRSGIRDRLRYTVSSPEDLVYLAACLSEEFLALRLDVLRTYAGPKSKAKEVVGLLFIENLLQLQIAPVVSWASSNHAAGHAKLQWILQRELSALLYANSDLRYRRASRAVHAFLNIEASDAVSRALLLQWLWAACMYALKDKLSSHASDFVCLTFQSMHGIIVYTIRDLHGLLDCEQTDTPSIRSEFASTALIRQHLAVLQMAADASSSISCVRSKLISTGILLFIEKDGNGLAGLSLSLGSAFILLIGNLYDKTGQSRVSREEQAPLLDCVVSMIRAFQMETAAWLHNIAHCSAGANLTHMAIWMLRMLAEWGKGNITSIVTCTAAPESKQPSFAALLDGISRMQELEPGTLLRLRSSALQVLQIFLELVGSLRVDSSLATKALIALSAQSLLQQQFLPSQTALELIIRDRFQESTPSLVELFVPFIDAVFSIIAVLDVRLNNRDAVENSYTPPPILLSLISVFSPEGLVYQTLSEKTRDLYAVTYWPALMASWCLTTLPFLQNDKRLSSLTVAQRTAVEHVLNGLPTQISTLLRPNMPSILTDSDHPPSVHLSSAIESLLTASLGSFQILLCNAWIQTRRTDATDQSCVHMNYTEADAIAEDAITTVADGGDHGTVSCALDANPHCWDRIRIVQLWQSAITHPLEALLNILSSYTPDLHGRTGDTFRLHFLYHAWKSTGMACWPIASQSMDAFLSHYRTFASLNSSAGARMTWPDPVKRSLFEALTRRLHIPAHKEMASISNTTAR